MSGIPIPNEDVFWGRVEKRALGECWVWKGAPIKNGYGQYRRKGTRSCYVHRLVYEALVGPIPEGKFLDHLCRNRLCVNPGHLEIVTNRENVLRGVGPTAVNAQKTHCKRGHPLEGENLYLYKDGRRDCRQCMHIRGREYYIQKGRDIYLRKKNARLL